MALGGAVAGSARVIVGADTRDLDRGMASAERTFTGSVGRIGTAALSLGGLLGAAGLAGAAKAAWDEFREGEKVAAQTEAVLKSTGGVAGVTASQVDKLAQAWLRKTGIDDEQIKSAENVLLTFTNVRNVVGQNNDVFNQATEAALNMSTALGDDLQGSVIRIGKALQDPIAGVTALRRVGVALTEQQKDQIKTLVESGDVLSAQKIILRELSTEFGGQAEAVGKSTGEWRILREELLNFGGQIAADAAPAVHELVTQLIEWLDQLEANKELQGEVKDAVRETVDVIRSMIDGANDVAEALGGWSDTLKLILTLGVAAKIGAMTAAFTKLAGTEAAAGVAGGSGIAGAAAGSSRLLTNLRALSRLGTIAVLIDVSLAINKQGAKSFWTDFVDAARQAALDPRKLVPGWQPFDPPPSERPADVGPSAGATAGLTAGTPAFRRQQRQILGYASRYGVGSGITYVWGGASPQVGFDCSGFLQQAYKAAGVDIPHNSVLQFNDPEALDTTGRELPGDGVYFETNGPGGPPQHCGIYLGSGRFIEYYSRGKPAKFNTIAAKGGYMGARRWLKIAHSDQGGTTKPKPTGAKPPPGGGPPPPTGTKELIPAGLRLAAAKAELTKGNADDIKALEDIERYLENRIAKEKNVETRIKLLNELKQVRDDLTRLRKGDPKIASDDDLIPARLRLRLVQAEMTKSNADDLKVLRDVEDYLEERARKEKNVEKRIEILNELKSIRERITALKPKEEEQPIIPRALQLRLAKAELTKTTKDDLEVLDDIIQYLETRIAREKDINKRLDLLAELKSYRDRVASTVTTPSDAAATFGQAVDRAIGGQPSDAPVRPGVFGAVDMPAVSEKEQKEIDKILASAKPQLDQWAAYARELLAKKKAAQKLLGEAKKSLNAALARPPKLRRPSLIAQLRADIAAYAQDIADLDAALQVAYERYGAIEAAMTDDILRAANEDEDTGGADKPPPDTGGGAVGGGFGGDTGGGGGPAGLTPEQIAAMRTEFLSARSGFFKEFGPNVFNGPPGLLELGSVSPLGAAPGNITIVQNFQTPPPDQFQYFKAAQFAAEHALG